MNYFIPAIITFSLQLYLLFSWFRSRRNRDGKELRLCFLGFLSGQLYLLWELILVKHTGKPLSGSAEQQALMGRLVLGSSLGGLFTIFGLFYVSFAYYGFLNNLKRRDKP